MSAYVIPIRLPSAYEELPVNANVILTGFGSSYFSGPTSSNLKKVSAKTVSNDHSQPYHAGLLMQTNFCTDRTIDHAVCIVSVKNHYFLKFSLILYYKISIFCRATVVDQW